VLDAGVVSITVTPASSSAGSVNTEILVDVP